jgi:signal transduction histidine kinase
MLKMADFFFFSTNKRPPTQLLPPRFFFYIRNKILLCLILGMAEKMCAQSPDRLEYENGVRVEEAFWEKTDRGCPPISELLEGFDGATHFFEGPCGPASKMLLEGMAAAMRAEPERGTAMSLFQKAQAAAERSDCRVLFARSCKEIAEEYLRSYQLDSAIFFLQKAEEKISSHSADLLKAEIERVYAGVYRIMLDSTKTFVHLHKGWALLEKLPSEPVVLRHRARMLHQLAWSHQSFGQHDRAVYFGEQAMGIGEQNGFARKLSLMGGLLGESYFRLGLLAKAGVHFEWAEKESRDPCRFRDRALVLAAYADFAHETGGHAKALNMARETEQLAGLSGDLSTLHRALVAQGNSLYALGRHREAYEVSIRADNLMDSLNDVIGSLKINEMESRQQALAKARELDVLNFELEERRGNIYYLTAITAVILLLVLVILLFILHRTRVNRQLREQALALANTNYTKDRLFSVVAHDLRSPLQALQTLLENEKRFRASGHDVDALLDRLKKKVADTRDLLNNLLLWAAQENRHLKADLQPTDLYQLLQEEWAQQQEDALLKDISLQLVSETRPTVRADVNMVRFAVRNLVSNALKFTPTGGKIVVTVRELTDRGKACVTVEDNGPGFAPDALEAIRAQPEQLVPKSNLSHGLGLMLTRSFLTQHGSELHIESATGQGAKISFCLELLPRA